MRSVPQATPLLHTDAGINVLLMPGTVYFLGGCFRNDILCKYFIYFGRSIYAFPSKKKMSTKPPQSRKVNF